MAVGIVAGWLLALAPGAVGATVAFDVSEQTIDILGGDEANQVSVTPGAGGDIVIADPSGSPDVDPSVTMCTAGPISVTWRPPSQVRLWFDVGGGSDVVGVAEAVTLQAAIVGGPGADFMVGGGGDDDFSWAAPSRRTAPAMS